MCKLALYIYIYTKYLAFEIVLFIVYLTSTIIKSLLPHTGVYKAKQWHQFLKKKVGENNFATNIEKFTSILRNAVENTRMIMQYREFEIGKTSKDRRKYILNHGKGQIGLFFL